MKSITSKNNRTGNLLARVLRENRISLSQDLFIAVRNEACASWKVPQQFEEVEEWGRCQLLTAIDLLAACFETDGAVFQELFAGWVHSRIAADLSEEGMPSDYNPGKAIELVQGSWIAVLRPRIPADALQILEQGLHQTAALLSRPLLKRVRVLFIGDCIQFEVIPVLIGPCLRAQIGVATTFVPERLQPAVRWPGWIRQSPMNILAALMLGFLSRQLIEEFL